MKITLDYIKEDNLEYIRFWKTKKLISYIR